MGTLKNILIKIFPHYFKSNNTFYDKETELKWVNIYKGNVEDYTQYFDEMKDWTDNPSIRKFISRTVPLNKLFLDTLPSENPLNSTRLYFCFEEEQYIGLILLSLPMGLNNHCSIEYIIVNPKYQGMGYGTRMVKSITSNLNLFSNNNGDKDLYSSVDEENFASQIAFQRNNFQEEGTNISFTGHKYKIYRFSPIDKNDSIEKSE